VKVIVWWKNSGKWLQFGSLFNECLYRKRGQNYGQICFIIKYEGLNPFDSLSPLLKVSQYISHHVYGIVICIGSAKGCIFPVLETMLLKGGNWWLPARPYQRSGEFFYVRISPYDELTLNPNQNNVVIWMISVAEIFYAFHCI
jgi:hypothetical protein